jgi:hypothetical protein
MLSWARNAEAFSTPDWERRAREEWDRYGRDSAGRGEWESRSDCDRRIEMDLATARRTLREKLGMESAILCWPENAFSIEAEAIARRLGCVATVSNRHDSRNAPGEAPDRIVRVFVGRCVPGVRSPLCDMACFVLEMKVFEGWYLAYPLLFVLHRVRVAARTARWLFAPAAGLPIGNDR